MKNCTFCKIINKEIETDIIYEDEHVIAILDIAPINIGHTLVLPREHHTSISSVSESIAGRITYIASRIGVSFKRSIEAEGYNLHLADGFCAGQEVQHAHMHAIPRYVNDGFHWNWRKKSYSEPTYSIASKIRNKLKVNNS